MSSKNAFLLSVERLYRAGRLGDALSELEAILSKPLDEERQVAALLLRASLTFDTADVNASIVTLRETIEIGSRLADPLWLYAGTAALFSTEAQFQSPNESLKALSTVRQLASHVGSSYSLGRMHLIVARLEALRGNTAEGRHHVELGRRLLELSSPVEFAAVLLVDGGLEICSGNARRGHATLNEGLNVARSRGRSGHLAGCLANLGSLHLLLGEDRKALSAFEAAGKLSQELLFVRFAIADALLAHAMYTSQMAVAAGHIDACGVAARRMRMPARSWYEFSHDVTRCTYHERLGDWPAVISIVDAHEPETSRRQFRAISAQLLSAKSRAYARLGDRDAAAAALSEAVRACPRSAVDPLISIEASRAAIAALRGDKPVARAHFERALAGCRAIGYRYHEKWVDRLRAELTDKASTVAVGADAAAQPSLSVLLNDVATILGSGHAIDILGHRLETLLRTSSLRDCVRVTHERGLDHQPKTSAEWQHATDGSVTITLRGSDRRATFSIDRVQSIDDVALVKSLVDIIRAAVGQESFSGEGEPEQLWPDAVATAEGDALFRSPRMLELVSITSRLATTEIPILLTGETGTGKEIFAKLVHEHSRRRKGPLVPFNCSAVTKDLVESQLFGHRRGAFTGATDAFDGVFKAAEGGTLFLDEVGDLDLAVQPKLLRFLESGEIQTLGDARPRALSVRIVAATNVDLEDLVAQGRFRRDLYYRLGVAKVMLPSLRERKDEIHAFASLFLSRTACEFGRANLTLSDDFVAALLLHDWPGNIRELLNEMRRIVALAGDGDRLTPDLLSPDIARRWFTRPTAPSTAAMPSVTVRLDQTLTDAIQQLEDQFIDRALAATGGRLSEAASLLGLSRKGLFLKRRRRSVRA